MNILVTGGTGFLGSHVADELSELGHHVVIFDRKTSPYLRPDQVMVTGDILNHEIIQPLIEKSDVVYHFAGIADIDECETKPLDTVQVNIQGTVALLDACYRANVQRFIFASSSYVYSDAGHFYRASKQACESYIDIYRELYGMNCICLRYGSLYGPRADARNSIHRLLTQAISHKKIEYHGTGNELREFIHVKDAARISALILSPEFVNENIIVTGLEKMSYKQLLSMITEMLKGDITVNMLPTVRKAHYTITPYNFSPKLGRKLINNPYIDMGQGLLQCMADIFEKKLPYIPFQQYIDR